MKLSQDLTMAWLYRYIWLNQPRPCHGPSSTSSLQRGQVAQVDQLESFCTGTGSREPFYFCGWSGVGGGVGETKL